MLILLIGYGKMGQAISGIAKAEGHNVIIADKPEDLPANVKGIDCAIEFSQPAAAPGNLEWCFRHNIPVVCGTTGWYQYKPLVDLLQKQFNGTYITSTNYSIGVNLFWHHVASMTKALEAQYNVGITEIHHTEKLDAPSGTAITTAEKIIAASSRYKDYKLVVANCEALPEDSIGITAIRQPNMPGLHRVTYTSDVDTIEIVHEAKGRQGFAQGALKAALWLVKQKPGSYSMEDFFHVS